jgi:hypothetical protein
LPYFLGEVFIMKRDMDLIRQLLLVAESDGKIQFETEHTPEEIADHAQMLIEERWIEGAVVRNHVGIPCGYHIIRLTMRGHDFLDAARSPKVWNAAKDKIQKEGIGWTLKIVYELLEYYAKTRLGIQ